MIFGINKIVGLRSNSLLVLNQIFSHFIAKFTLLISSLIPSSDTFERGEILAQSDTLARRDTLTRRDTLARRHFSTVSLMHTL